ncbi:hypothetical protein AAMO2058_001236500 [Amorphochlora amoebiformis]
MGVTDIKVDTCSQMGVGPPKPCLDEKDVYEKCMVTWKSGPFYGGKSVPKECRELWREYLECVISDRKTRKPRSLLERAGIRKSSEPDE